MAKKPAPAHQHIEELPPAMDYAQHQATWNAVTGLVKWSIAGLAIVAVALYCFIEGGQPLLGGVLLFGLFFGSMAFAVY